MKITVLSFFLFIFVLGVNAQNLDDVFDDGGLSNVNGSLSTNITQLIEGDINIGYNKFLNDKSYSIGLAAGYRAFNGYSLSYGATNNFVEGGYYLEFNFYNYDYLFKDFYIGEIVRYNRNHTSTEKYNNIELVINVGYRYYLTSRLSVAADIGISYTILDYGGITIPARITFGIDI